jgi:tetratricopeptide (TPR) repeat protein
MRTADKLLLGMVVGAVLILSCGCKRMVTPGGVQMVNDADARAANGDFLAAISLYERALDGSPGSAEIHYKVALLYDDKMKEPLHAIHHFKRYLTLAPSGPRAEEVKNYLKRDELELLTTLSGDSVLSRAEATRLKNENLSLRQQLEERRLAETRAAATNREPPARATRAKNSSRSKRTTQR